MIDQNDISGYRWEGAELTCAHNYLMPVVAAEIERLTKSNMGARIFELGCGNGSVANYFSQKGWEVVGVDPSVEGIAQANSRYPHLNLQRGSAYEELYKIYGQYPIVTSLEVVEHVYFPRLWAATLFSLLVPGGTAIISTPYHGYWKNLALALTGKMDAHFTALWDHGHIKFWSCKTISSLLFEAGFDDLKIIRVGRIAPLAKSMIVLAKKAK